MRILIISHNVISNTSNMGKTILNYFKEMEDVEIAQFYIHSEIPNNDEICTKYYRFTDVDALKSVLHRRHTGTKFYKKDILKDLVWARVDKGHLKKIYTKGSKRTPLTYLGRDMIWRLSQWKSNELMEWVKDFNPDIIFLASGDYSFIYDIAYEISADLHCPLVVACLDDFYLYNKNEKVFLGKLQHNLFMKSVYRCIGQSDLMVTICEPMAHSYEKLFNKKNVVLHTAANDSQINFAENRTQISYMGNLGLNRAQQLIVLGNALQNIQDLGIPKYIDIYSAENIECITEASEAAGIRFHGMISPTQMEEVYKKSLLVIHTEAFDKEIVERVKFSVSTKIPELLSRGPCILVYGPSNVASIDYLKNNEAAYVITSNDNLEERLKEIICNKRLQEQIICNARDLAKKNHNSKKNAKYLKEQLDLIVG